MSAATSRSLRPQFRRAKTLSSRYTGFTGGATSPVFPLINANNAGYQHRYADSECRRRRPTDVTVSYTPSIGRHRLHGNADDSGPWRFGHLCAGRFRQRRQPPTVPPAPSSSVRRPLRATAPASPWSASATSCCAGINGEAYGSFDPASATSVVVMPLIMDRNSGYFTGFNLQNVGSSSTTVNCTFTNTSYTVSGTIAPGAALNDIQNNKIGDGYIGSARCTASDTNAQLVGRGQPVAARRHWRPVPGLRGHQRNALSPLPSKTEKGMAMRHPFFHWLCTGDAVASSRSMFCPHVEIG